MEVTYKIQSLQNKKATTRWLKKNKVTVKFYGKLCLPVITWYKQHSSNQVLPTTYTLDRKVFAVPVTFEDLRVHLFQAD